MKVLIAADIVPTQSNYEQFAKANIESLFGDDIVRAFNEASCRIANLEVPLSDKNSPIGKNGPNLIAPSSAVNALHALHIDLVTLANNHIMDQGSQGLESTMKVLSRKGIAYTGAGQNSIEARRPFILDGGELKIGIYACAEHEFSIATETESGANPFDELNSLDDIFELKKTCDYVVVLYHGGREHYPYPTPLLQRRCRRMVDKGADLVVCQHSHCVGCKEVYKSGTIVYGQGNFLFDKDKEECWKTGLLISINENKEIEFMPIKKEKNGVRLANGDDADSILQSFEKRSKEICLNGFVEQKFMAYVNDYSDGYFLRLSGNTNLLFRIFNRLTKHRLQQIIVERYLRQNKYVLRNFIECEAHREIILSKLKMKTGRETQ